MASKDKKPAAKKSATTTKVTRITAQDTKKSAPAPAVVKKAKTTKVVDAPAKKPAAAADEQAQAKTGKKNPFAALIGYFKGAWYELSQVNWPTRKATWSLTAALLVFTAFFAVLILMLDAVFKNLFELMLG